MAADTCDVFIAGAGTGGCAAALAACSLGMSVIMTEPTTMIGGQLTAQMVPPDEHRWIEEFGCTARYRAYRNDVRAVCARRSGSELGPNFNPGGGWVSRLCHTPRDGVAALMKQLTPFLYGGLLDLRLRCRVERVEVDGDLIHEVTIANDNRTSQVRATVVLDATELGDLLPLAQAEYRSGSESVNEFDEPHATALAEPDNVQGFTWCFAMSFDHRTGRRMGRPAQYDRWATYTPAGWPGHLLSFTFPDPVSREPRTLPLLSSDALDRSTLFAYRQIVDPSVVGHRKAKRAVTAVNWPQNDYFLGSVIDVPTAVSEWRLLDAKALGRSLLYWLQTEAPRHDGGIGYPELVVRRDIAETSDGFAVAPYHRESRRMVTRHTVTEQMVSADCNPDLDRAPVMPKSVGVGHYRIDLHPSANGHGYIDIPSLPFQIPLGALIPVRLRNLLPACKNLGVTHITNGCYRLHPVEWNIGEAAGLLAAFCVTRNTEPAAVYENEELWMDFERLAQAQGVETAWPDQPLNLKMG
ncbi:MAG: FAD-dependent oxidoreductase [Fimbriimonadaceae bacterium]